MKSLHPSPSLPRRGNERGFALVVVLSFVTLLVVVVLAYFSHAALQHEISNSSAGKTKADIFARGAANTVIGDLQQEIAASSTATNIATGVTLFRPLTNQSMVPQTSGSFSRTGGLENLVKISRSGTPC